MEIDQMLLQFMVAVGDWMGIHGILETLLDSDNEVIVSAICCGTRGLDSLNHSSVESRGTWPKLVGGNCVWECGGSGRSYGNLYCGW